MACIGQSMQRQNKAKILNHESELELRKGMEEDVKKWKSYNL